jgi:hypothetical protein
MCRNACLLRAGLPAAGRDIAPLERSLKSHACLQTLYPWDATVIHIKKRLWNQQKESFLTSIPKSHRQFLSVTIGDGGNPSP